MTEEDEGEEGDEEEKKKEEAVSWHLVPPRLSSPIIKWTRESLPLRLM